MIINAKPMGCGGCGGTTFKIYQQRDQSVRLVVECLQCHSTSIVAASRPTIEISWGTGDGCLAIDPSPASRDQASPPD